MFLGEEAETEHISYLLNFSYVSWKNTVDEYRISNAWEESYVTTTTRILHIRGFKMAVNSSVQSFK